MTTATTLEDRLGGVLASTITSDVKASYAISTDLPSTGDQRPFGLSLAVATDPTQTVKTAGFRYDPGRQMTVDTDGVPAIISPAMAKGQTKSHTTPYDTEFDGLTETDKQTDD